VAATLWTAGQLAEYLKVSAETVWRCTREGKLPAIKIDNHYRYPVEEAIEALRNARKEPPDDDVQRDEAVRTPDRAAGRRMTYEEFSTLPEQPGLQLIDQVLQPDIMFVSTGRRSLITEKRPLWRPGSCGRNALSLDAEVRRRAEAGDLLRTRLPGNVDR